MTNNGEVAEEIIEVREGETGPPIIRLSSKQPGPPIIEGIANEPNVEALQQVPWNYTGPFIIVSGVRTGGTLLAHMLDSHPNVCCDRGEPLNKDGPFRKALPNIDPKLIFQTAITRQGCPVIGCKLPYAHLLEVGLETVLHFKPRIIHATRVNTLERAISYCAMEEYGTTQGKGRTHTFLPLPKYTVRPDPGKVMYLCEMWEYARDMWDRMLTGTGLPVFEVTYRQQTEGQTEVDQLPDELTDRLCEFLGVPSVPLTAAIRRMNPQPLSERCKNWEDIKAALYRNEKIGHLVDGWIEGNE